MANSLDNITDRLYHFFRLVVDKKYRKSVDDINNLLINLVKDDIRDPVSQEAFRPGQRIHLCLVHRLAYHEDSWQAVGYKCITCGHGSNTKVYTLPTPPDDRIRWTNIKYK
jgi:hypothetical protein